MQSNGESKPKRKCSKAKIFKHVVLQLFDFGSSAGSLITEILGILKTFQKITAPLSFYYCFSHETSKFCEWINNIINIFANFFKTNPLDFFELYSLYCLIFPLVILMFISLMADAGFGYLGLIACAIFFIFGAGFALCQGYYSLMCLGIFMIIISFFVIVIGLCKVRCKCCNCCDCCERGCFSCFDIIFHMFIKPYNEQNQTESQENNDAQNQSSLSNPNSEKFAISKAFYPTSLILYLISIPIMIKREKYLKIIAVIYAILYIIVFPLNILTDHFLKKFMLKVSSKGINFLVTCLSLLIIPATDTFIELVEENRSGVVHCTVTYIFVSLIFPIILTNYMIKYEHPDIYDKYKEDQKKCCRYAGIEVWDILKQMTYAIIAAFDIAELCLTVEVIWILIIIIKRPYCSCSQTAFVLAHSFVAVLSNFGICYVKYTNSTSFNFNFSLILIVVAFVPAIIAMIIFFSVEFEITEEDEKEKEKHNQELVISLGKLSRIINIILPCVWFFYGINIYIISTGNNIWK